MMKRVLIFGTFDRFDEGHQFFVEQASKIGTELVVGVARDEHVRILKKKEPIQSENERLLVVKTNPLVSDSVLCDEKLGTYHILDEIKPDVIAIGFDQDAFKADLERWLDLHDRNIPIELMGYLPE